MWTELHFKDTSGKAEYTIECDNETGYVTAWHVTLTEPLPMQTILNMPMLMRVVSSAPCGQTQPSDINPVMRKYPNGVPAPNTQSATRIKIGKDGNPR